MKQHHPPLPREHHVLRHIPSGKLIRDSETDAVVGIFSIAFRENPSEGMSVTWVEYWTGKATDPLAEAAATLKQTRKGKNARIAQGNVGQIIETGQKYDAKTRIVHDPDANNPGHSLIKDFSYNDDFFEELSESIFSLIP